MPKKEPHVHEYIRVNNLDGSPDKNRYRCAAPDCHHWMFRNMLKGKRTRCTSCHIEEFFLDRESLRRAKPVCFKCSGTKQAKEVRNRLSDLEDLFKEPEIPSSAGAAPSVLPDWTRKEN